MIPFSASILCRVLLVCKIGLPLQELSTSSRSREPTNPPLLESSTLRILHSQQRELPPSHPLKQEWTKVKVTNNSWIDLNSFIPFRGLVRNNIHASSSCYNTTVHPFPFHTTDGHKQQFITLKRVIHQGLFSSQDIAD